MLTFSSCCAKHNASSTFCPTVCCVSFEVRHYHHITTLRLCIRPHLSPLSFSLSSSTHNAETRVLIPMMNQSRKETASCIMGVVIFTFLARSKFWRSIQLVSSTLQPTWTMSASLESKRVLAGFEAVVGCVHNRQCILLTHFCSSHYFLMFPPCSTSLPAFSHCQCIRSSSIFLSDFIQPLVFLRNDFNFKV